MLVFAQICTDGFQRLILSWIIFIFCERVYACACLKCVNENIQILTRVDEIIGTRLMREYSHRHNLNLTKVIIKFYEN